LIGDGNTFYVFCDETGTIFDPSENAVYGIGQAIIRKDEIDAIKKDLARSFPDGLHCKDLNFYQRKDAVSKLASLLRMYRSPIFVSYIESKSNFAQNIFYNSFSSKAEAEMSISKEKLLADRIKGVKSKSEILHPRDVFPDVLNGARMLQIYMHALRVGIVDSLIASEDPENAIIRVYMPTIAEPTVHQGMFEKFKDNFSQNLPQFLATVKKNGTVKALPINPIQLILIRSNSNPLLWLADVSAMIGRMLAQEDDSRGMELYNVMKDFYMRSVMNGQVKVPGVFITNRNAES
jgi:hypothetical protein